jgi:hypothetical protein
VAVEAAAVHLVLPSQVRMVAQVLHMVAVVAVVPHRMVVQQQSIQQVLVVQAAKEQL